MINKIVILTSFILICFSAMAQDLKSDAVYLEQTKEYTLNKDGSWSYHYSHKLLINTYYAFHNLYGEDFIVYDPAFQKLKINRSVTTMADGKQVASPENAFNELLPRFAANVPAWNRLREMVVTHTALERGATIDFDYTLTSAKEYTPAMMVNEVLWMNSPVKKLTFIVTVPSGAALQFEQYGFRIKPVVSKQGNATTYTWTLTDLDAAMREDFRPKDQQNRPRIVLAASNKPKDAMAVFASQEAFKCEATSEIKAAASATVAGINDPLLKTLKLQEKVANELNTWTIPLLNCGNKLRNTSAIWQSNGGTDAEKALVFTAMLRSQSITAEPVAVMSDGIYTKKTASPALIERFLVKVSIQGFESLLLSPVQIETQDLRYLLAGKRIISLVPGKNQPSEVIREYKNTLSVSGNLNLSNDPGLNGNLSLELGGRINPWLKMQKDTTYATTMLANALGNAKITEMIKGRTDMDLSSFSFSGNANAYTTEKAKHVFLKIPAIAGGTESWHMNELVSKRNEPLEIPFPVSESYDLFIHLPDGMTLVSPVEKLTMSNEFGNLSILIATEGNQLHIVREIQISKTYVPVEKYETFKTFINCWNNKKYREVVLKKAN